MPQRVDIDHPLVLAERPSILVLRVDRMGDVLVSQPFFRLLRKRFPDAHIDILLGERNANLQTFVKRYATSTFVYRKSVVALIPLILSLRKQKYDVVIDMHDNASRTSALLMKWSGAPLRLGFDKQNSSVYTHVVERADRTHTHIVQLMASLMNAFGVQPKPEDLSLEVPGINALELHNVAAAPAKTVDVFINISAGKDSMWWGTDRWTELALKLKSAKPELRICIGSDSVYRAQRLDIAQRSDCAVVPDALDFSSYALQLRCARIIISPDTSIVHLASALSIPSVVLYAKPHADRMPWWPFATDYEACIASADDGVQTITVDQVFDACLKLLDRSSIA